MQIVIHTFVLYGGENLTIEMSWICSVATDIGDFNMHRFSRLNE